MRSFSRNLNSPISLAIDGRLAERIALLALLLAIDSGMIMLALWWAYRLRFESSLPWFYQPEILPVSLYSTLSFFLLPYWILIFWIFGLYDYKRLFSGVYEYAKAFNAVTFGMMMIVLHIFFAEETIARGWILITWILIGLFVMSGRFALRRGVQYLRVRGRFLTAVLIVGANEEGQAIAQQLQSNRNAGIWVAAFVDDALEAGNEPLPGVPVLGPTYYLEAMVQYLDIHEIIIASTGVPHDKFIEIFQRFGTRDSVTVRLSSGLYELITTGVEVKEIGNVPLMTVNKMRLTGFETVFKRALDLLISTISLLLLWPVMILIAIAIKWDSHGPILYRRKVVGVGGKPFYALKFRTMYIDADERLTKNPELCRQFNQNHKLKNDPRITRAGKWLRRTSLDEVPQLVNVLVGQMSLVGPRMITEEERSRYGKWHLNLFTVKPGITGLWQVSGRSDVSYEERVMLDMHYIRNYSIWSDLYVLWLTVPAVLKGRGAY